MIYSVKSNVYKVNNFEQSGPYTGKKNNILSSNHYNRRGKNKSNIFLDETRNENKVKSSNSFII